MNHIIWRDMQNVESRREDWFWLCDQSVLITGAYGMLASYIVFFLVYLNETYFGKEPIQIYACGRNRGKMQQLFGEYCERDYFHQVNGDVCDEMEIPDRIDYIVHAASLASPQYYKVNPVGTLMPNVIGTYRMLELARDKNVKGFLFFSSGDVYGQLPDTQLTVSEMDSGYIDPMNVRSCYGESKRMGETMCTAWWQQYRVPAKSVRIYHTYGPTMDIEKDERMFSEFTNCIVNGRDIVMKSDGKAVRSLCYLADALDAFLRILKDGAPGTAYNLCNNDGHVSVNELAQTLVNLWPEKKLKVVQVERELGTAYLESPVKIVPDVSTARLNQLGWRPQFDIAEGFRRTICSFWEREDNEKS